MSIFIKRENFKSKFISNLIKDWNDSTGMFSNPNSQGWHFEWNMAICNFKGLLVVSTHIVNSLFVNFSSLFVLEMSEELSKWVSYEVNCLFLCDPVWNLSCQSLFHISKIFIFFSHLLLVHSSFSSKLLTNVVAFTLRVSIHGRRHPSVTSFGSVLLVEQSVYLCSLASIELILVLIINSFIFIAIKFFYLLVVLVHVILEIITVSLFFLFVHFFFVQIFDLISFFIFREGLVVDLIDVHLIKVTLVRWRWRLMLVSHFDILVSALNFVEVSFRSKCWVVGSTLRHKIFAGKY